MLVNSIQGMHKSSEKLEQKFTEVTTLFILSANYRKQ